MWSSPSAIWWPTWQRRAALDNTQPCVKCSYQRPPCVDGHCAQGGAPEDKFGQHKGLRNGEPLLLRKILVVKQLFLQREEYFVGVTRPGKYFCFVPVWATVQAAQVLVCAGNSYGDVACQGTSASNWWARGFKDQVTFTGSLRPKECQEGFRFATRGIDGHTSAGKVVRHNAEGLAGFCPKGSRIFRTI